MYLAGFRIYGYKSFLDSGLVNLKPGFNILTGQNNAGKTALLEGLSLRLQEKPHRSLVNAPTPLSYHKAKPQARVHIAVTLQELSSFLGKGNDKTVLVPFSKSAFRSPQQAWRALLKQQEIQFEFAAGIAR